MTDASQTYEVPKRWKAEEITQLAKEELEKSPTDLRNILEKHEIPADQAAAIATQVAQAPPEIEYAGSGSSAEVVAIIVSLAPVIKVLTPFLQPFAKKGSDLAYEIGKDIWAMLKDKLHQKNVRLSEKPKAHGKKSARKS